jgi:hypothetical protein
VNDSETFDLTTAPWSPPSGSDADSDDSLEQVARRVARVLIYVGCFNPPHISHLNLLLHVYNHARCLNIVHAIIVPLSEASCMLKNPPKYFTFDERKEFWEGDPEFPSWANVISRSELDAYRMNAKQNIPQLGNDEVRFITLLGPDHVSIGLPAPQGRDTEEVITSDQIRPADFDSTTNEHGTFSDCSSWMVVSKYKHAEFFNFTPLDLSLGSFLPYPLDLRANCDSGARSSSLVCINGRGE